MNSRRLSFIYITALLSIALLAGLAHIIMQNLIAIERTSGELVNLSGKQRMLTQKAALLSMQLSSRTDADKTVLKAQLNDIANAIDSNHQTLIHGNTEQRLPSCPASAYNIFFGQPYELDKKLREYTGLIRMLAAEPNDHLASDSPILRHIIATASGDLYVLNNRLVETYQTVSEDRIDSLVKTELYILAVILLVLLLEGRYVFRPMVKRIEEDKHRLETLNAELASLSLSDGLTGIPNRRYFDTRISSEWRRLSRESKPLSLAMIDIDHFKAYNDTYGHQAGDACLKIVAATIKTALKRPADLAARYGGEEFAVILPNTDKAGAIKVAEILRSAIEQLKVDHSNSLVSNVVTVSVGVASFAPDNELQPADLIKAADSALYKAKASGRNRVVSA